MGDIKPIFITIPFMTTLKIEAIFIIIFWKMNLGRNGLE